MQCGQIINDYCLDSRHRPETLDKETKHSYFLTSLYWTRGVSLPGGKIEIKGAFNRKCSISVMRVVCCLAEFSDAHVIPINTNVSNSNKLVLSYILHREIEMHLRFMLSVKY